MLVTMKKEITGQFFYLLKELISKFEQCEYNFFRGQTESWPTIPALFEKKKSIRTVSSIMNSLSNYTNK